MGAPPSALSGALWSPWYSAAAVSEPESVYTHPATNPPNAVPSNVPSGAPPYPGCTTCHSPNTRATSASRNASSSVTSATIVSATRKKTNAAAKPDAGTVGRSTAMSKLAGRSAAAAATPYQRNSARCRVVATAPPQAATPASSASEAARSSRHSRARSASLPCQMSAAAHAAPTAKPRATSGTARCEPAGPHANPSGRRAASSAIRAHTPAASGTAVPPASCRTTARRGRPAALLTRHTASARRARPERSSELDMALAHADRPRPEVHEQGAVGTQPAGATGRRGAELAAPQPVTRREGGALLLRERRVERRAADQRRHQPVEHIEPAHVREPLLERDGATRNRRRHRIAHVDADAHGEPLQSLPLPPPLAQNPGELAVVEQHIVGPFETRDRTAEQGIDRVGDRQAGADPYGPQHGVLRAEQHAEPD